MAANRKVVIPHPKFPRARSPSPPLGQCGSSELEDDKIGSTNYSKKFVLKMLTKMKNASYAAFKLDKRFETELEAFWDMTTEKEVITFLLSNKVYEVFAKCLQLTEDLRLIEIIIGILANMSVNEAQKGQEFFTNRKLFFVFLAISIFPENSTLMQVLRLMRDFHSVRITSDEDFAKVFELLQENSDFMYSICLIFNSALCPELLKLAYAALNAMLITYASVIEVDQSFSSFFANEELIKASLVGFQTFFPKSYGGTGRAFIKGASRGPVTDESKDGPFVADAQVCRDFIGIHFILSQYGPEAKSCYTKNLDDAKICLRLTMKMLCKEFVNKLEEEEVHHIQNIIDFIQCVEEISDAEVTAKTVELFDLVERKSEVSQSEEEELLKKEFTSKVGHLLNVLVDRSSEAELKKTFDMLNKPQQQTLMKNYKLKYGLDDN